MSTRSESELSSNIDEKLKAISPNLDLTQGPPINQKRTVTFINHFIITMVEFLNNFARSCECKLFECDQKIKKMEDELCLLEAKLNSIPEVADIEKPKEVNEELPAPKEEKTEAPSPVLEQVEESKEDSKEPEVNPELAKYYKMIQFGVPIQAVKLKMQQEGLDPNLLATKE